MVLLFLLAKKTQGAVVTHTNESRNDTGKRKKGEHPSTQHSIIQMADSHQKTTVKSTMSCAPKHCNTTAQLDQLEGTNEWKKGFNYYVVQLHNDIQWLYNWIKNTSWISCFLDGLGMKSLWTSVLRISKPPDFRVPKQLIQCFSTLQVSRDCTKSSEVIMWKLDLKDMTNMTSFCGEWLELGVCIHFICT